MRSLEKNKRTLYYAVYMGEEPLLDDRGFETGESKPIYGEKTMLRCNISQHRAKKRLRLLVTSQIIPALYVLRIITVLSLRSRSCGSVFLSQSHITTLLPSKRIARTVSCMHSKRLR